MNKALRYLRYVLGGWLCCAAAAGDIPDPPTILCTPATRHGVFREADAISVQTVGNVPIQVTDLDGAVVYQGDPTTLHLTRGHYFVKTDVDATGFAVVPDDYAGASFIGSEGAGHYDDWSLLDALRPGWIRMHGGSGAPWSEVQPQAGIWDWTTADEFVTKNTGNGRRVLWMAMTRPDWQTNDKQFISLFTNYLGRVAQRYGNQLYGIIIWNEPSITCGQWGRLPNPDKPNQCMTNLSQMVRAYANVLKASYAAVHSVAPGLHLFGPSWSNPQYDGITADLGKLGTMPLLEALSFHDYDCWGSPPDEAVPFRGTGPIMPRVDQRVKALRTGLDDPLKPFLVDELGFFGESALGFPNAGEPTYLSGLSWQRGMYRAVKTTVMYRAVGAEAIMPHVLNGSTGDPANNIEIYGYELGGRGPHPKSSAFLMAGYWLDDATLVDFRTLDNRVFLYAWQRPDNTSLVFAWTLEGQTVALTSPANVRDIFGRSKQINMLTEEPVLFSANNSDTSVLLQSVMARLAEYINLAPVLVPIANQNVMKDTTAHFTIAATDADNDPVTFSTGPLPLGAQFDPVTATFSWTPSASQLGQHSVVLTATDARGLSDSVTTLITVLGSPQDGLIHEWRFNESTGTNASDSVGAATGKLFGFGFTSGSGWTAGVSSNALAFDGTDDFVELNSQQFNLTNNIAITAWLRPKPSTGNSVFLSLCSTYLKSGLRIYVAEHSMVVQGQTTAGWQGSATAPGTVRDDAWQHVAIIFDKSRLTIYLNGVIQGSADWGGDLVMNPTSKSRIGTHNSYFYKGAIDELRIYNRTLAPEEIQKLASINPSNTRVLVLKTIKQKTARAGRTVRLRLSAINPNHQPLTFSLTPLPADATFDAARGKLVWITTNATAGTYSLTAGVTDGTNSDTKPVSITLY